MAVRKESFEGVHGVEHAVARRGFRARLSRIRERLERSRRVFILGVLVACAVEVVLDWNATIVEINTLRDRVRERATSYVALLDKSAAAPILAGDARATEAISAGVFDDPDVVYLRACDASGRVLFERLDPAFATKFEARRGQAFGPAYAKQLERDTSGMLNDPDGLRDRMMNSRHRDFVQSWNDLVKGAVALVVKPDPPRKTTGSVLYQDRLHTDAHEHDAGVTWALARVLDPETQRPAGVLLVAFSMDRTNEAIVGKLWKGAGIIALFVALLVVQNLFSRRDKVRLLAHEARQREARAAIRATLPAPLKEGPCRITGHVDQTEVGVDGVIWDHRATLVGHELLLVDPLGQDSVTAAVAIGVVGAYRKLGDRRNELSLKELLGELAEAARGLPLTPRLGALLLRIDARTGALEAYGTELAFARTIGGEASFSDAGEPPDDTLLGPMRALVGTLPEGATLLLVGDGVEPKATRLDADRVLDFVKRGLKGDLHDKLADVAAWTRGKFSATAAHDLALIAVTRV